MSNVDIFATGPAEQSLWWEEISLKAMTLDIADVLDNSYSISTFGGPGLTPSTSKRKLRSSQSSPLHQQRRRPIPHFEDTDSHSEEEEEDEDEEVEQEGEGEEGTEEQGPEGLDEMATPTNCPSGYIPSSSGSSMLLHFSKTPRTPFASEPPQKKRKRDTITSIAKQLAEMTQQNAASLATIQMQTELAKQQTELALAQIRVENTKERMANLELYRSNQEFMRQELITNRELTTQNREMLQILLAKIGIEPLATLPPNASPPVMQLQGQPSSSNISNALSSSNHTKGPPPLPIDEAMPIPPPPAEKNVPDILPTLDLDEALEDHQRRCADDIATAEIQPGQNLSKDASEVEPGSDALSTGDQPAGSAL